jgi:hypothetical protein
VERSGRKKYKQRGMEEAPENGKESSYSAHVNGMNEWMNECSNEFRRLWGYTFFPVLAI